jgi:ornithine cyclodeaminase
VHELSEVVAGDVVGRHADTDIVLFKSLGIAAEDLAVGAVALARARERGLGVQL